MIKKPSQELQLVRTFGRAKAFIGELQDATTFQSTDKGKALTTSKIAFSNRRRFPEFYSMLHSEEPFYSRVYRGRERLAVFEGG